MEAGFGGLMTAFLVAVATVGALNPMSLMTKMEGSEPLPLGSVIQVGLGLWAGWLLW